MKNKLKKIRSILKSDEARIEANRALAFQSVANFAEAMRSVKFDDILNHSYELQNELTALAEDSDDELLEGYVKAVGILNLYFFAQSRKVRD